MQTSAKAFRQVSGCYLQKAAFALTLLAGFALALTISGYAQTYTILHDFTGGTDGGAPQSSPLVDAGGNLYGTASIGGIGNGVVYKLTHRASGWMFTRLYTFQGGMDGASPVGGLVFGPDGALYGTTAYGGGGPCTSGNFTGCGTVFRLTPRPTACPTSSCPWNETILYRFQSFGDAAIPWSALTFDPAGNIYGTTLDGGAHSNGTVYELAHTNGGWSESVLYSFGGRDGLNPHREVIFDAAGNLYGTTYQGGANDCGVVFELSPTQQSGWVETVLYNAVCWPGPQYIDGGVTFGSPNTLYASSVNGGQPNGGTVFKLSLANGVWSESTLYALQEDSVDGPVGTPVLDQAGNIYENTFNEGLGCGSVFKLTNSSGNWLFSDLHDFNNTDGCYPAGDVHLDRSGNMFGATWSGGNSVCFLGGGGCGIIWEITP